MPPVDVSAISCAPFHNSTFYYAPVDCSTIYYAPVDDKTINAVLPTMPLLTTKRSTMPYVNDSTM